LLIERFRSAVIVLLPILVSIVVFVIDQVLARAEYKNNGSRNGMAKFQRHKMCLREIGCWAIIVVFDKYFGE
jgi:hypothetical protein